MLPLPSTKRMLFADEFLRLTPASVEVPRTEKPPPTCTAPVVVALVVVAFTPVKFWRVVEPVAVSVFTLVEPVADMFEAPRFVVVAFTAAKLEEYRFVDVALVVVAFTPVKF